MIEGGDNVSLYKFLFSMHTSLISRDISSLSKHPTENPALLVRQSGDESTKAVHLGVRRPQNTREVGLVFTSICQRSKEKKGQGWDSH